MAKTEVSIAKKIENLNVFLNEMKLMAIEEKLTKSKETYGDAIEIVEKRIKQLEEQRDKATA